MPEDTESEVTDEQDESQPSTDAPVYSQKQVTEVIAAADEEWQLAVA
jgi:hypothetical protein